MATLGTKVPPLNRRGVTNKGRPAVTPAATETEQGPGRGQGGGAVAPGDQAAQCPGTGVQGGVRPSCISGKTRLEHELF